MPEKAEATASLKPTVLPSQCDHTKAIVDPRYDPPPLRPSLPKPAAAIPAGPQFKFPSINHARCCNGSTEPENTPIFPKIRKCSLDQVPNEHWISWDWENLGEESHPLRQYSSASPTSPDL